MNKLNAQIQRELRRAFSQPKDSIDRETLVLRLKIFYELSIREERADNLVPEDDAYLKKEEHPVLNNTVINRCFVNYDWPPDGGFKGTKTEATLHKGDMFDRIGDSEGMYVSPIEYGKLFNREERALPYYLLEETIRREPAYHVYEVVEDFERLPEKVCNSNDNAILLGYLKGAKLDGFEKGMSLREFISRKGYRKPIPKGRVASCFGKIGGGIQIKLPLSIQSLLELEMIQEI